MVRQIYTCKTLISRYIVQLAKCKDVTDYVIQKGQSTNNPNCYINIWIMVSPQELWL